MTLMPYEDYRRMRDGHQSLHHLGGAFLVVPVPVTKKGRRTIWLTSKSAKRAVDRAREDGRKMEIIPVELAAIRRHTRRGRR